MDGLVLDFTSHTGVYIYPDALGLDHAVFRKVHRGGPHCPRPFGFSGHWKPHNITIPVYYLETGNEEPPRCVYLDISDQNFVYLDSCAPFGYLGGGGVGNIIPDFEQHSGPYDYKEAAWHIRGSRYLI